MKKKKTIQIESWRLLLSFFAMEITLAFLFLFALCVVGSAPSKPHIVFIMVDDWGWANVGYHRYLLF
jgi:hypothetical protein